MSDKKRFLFRDNIALPAPKSLFSDSKQLLVDSQGSNGSTGVRVTIQATYSGYLLNNRVYPGRRMRDGAKSWLSTDNGGTSGFNKPFLLHHDMREDAIGRVDFQKFTALKTGTDFKEDWRTPSIGTDLGSGFITLSGIISDADAQAKVLDGRYKTVSTGQSSDQAFCSICKADWAGVGWFDEEPCEHTPGTVHKVDGKKFQAYLVTGKLDYDECSFVNMPANENASVISADLDSLNKLVDEEGNRIWVSQGEGASILSVQLVDSAGHSTELILPPGAKDEIPYGSDNVKPRVLVSVPDTWGSSDFADAKDAADLPEESDTDNSSDKEIDRGVLPNGNKLTVYSDGKIRVTSASDAESVSSAGSDGDMTDEEFALARMALTLQEAGILSEEILDESICDISFDDCIEMIGELRDAGLSNVQYSKLSKGSFCGPNRSFPVSDCADVSAASRLLGRAKVSDSMKERIRSSIDRKARQLGCIKGNDNIDQDQGVALMSTPDKTSDSANTDTTDDKSTVQVLTDALADAKTKFESIEADLAKKTQLYDAKVTENKAVLDELADLKASYKKQVASQLITVQMQLGKPAASSVKDHESFEALVDTLAGRTIDSLLDSVNDLIPEMAVAFKKHGLPSFVKDSAEPKPGVQGRTASEGTAKPKDKSKSEDPSNLI